MVKPQTVLAPAGDILVNSYNPQAILNRMGLAAGKWAYLNRSLIQFGISGLVPGDVQTLELRLYGIASIPPIAVEVHFTANPFSEQTTSWANQPSPTLLNGSSLMGSIQAVPTSIGWLSITLDPRFLKERITAGATYLVMIIRGVNETGADSYCYFEDREGSLELGAQYAPQLVVNPQVSPPLVATLSASPASGPAPLAVTFTIGISGGVTPYTWTLDYGDGSTPGSGTIAGTQPHTYNQVGTFTATLTVTDALGASTASRSKVMAGVIIQSWVSVLAPLAVGATLLKVAR